MFVRVWAVLKWWYLDCGQEYETAGTIEALAKALSKEGTDLDLTISPSNGEVKPLARRVKK
jgi:hypothetical protein